MVRVHLESAKGLKPFKTFSLSLPFSPSFFISFTCLTAQDIPSWICVINWFQIVPLGKIPSAISAQASNTHSHTHTHTPIFKWNGFVLLFCHHLLFKKFTFKLPFVCVYSTHLRSQCLLRREMLHFVSTPLHPTPTSSRYQLSFAPKKLNSYR